jgi:hypothetical protein
MRRSWVFVCSYDVSKAQKIAVLVYQTKQPSSIEKAEKKVYNKGRFTGVVESSIAFTKDATSFVQVLQVSVLPW